MNSRSRLRSVQVERCSQIFYEPTTLRDGFVVEERKKSMNSTGAHNGCCDPTTSTSPLTATSSSNSITVVSGHKSRGIVHSITESGTGRLLFEENFTRMRGVLLNEYEESISISGTSTPVDPKADPLRALLSALPAANGATPPSSPQTTNGNGASHTTNTVHRTMTITVVDGEAGQKFCVENVDVLIMARMAAPPPWSPPAADGEAAVASKAPLGSPTRAAGTDSPTRAGTGANTASPQLWVEIRHPSLRFQTDDVFIGNRADVEIQKYLGGWGAGRLARANSRSGSNHHLPYSPSANLASPAPNALYVGAMAVNVMSMERTAPSVRRMSTCDGCATNIIERANDFLV